MVGYPLLNGYFEIDNEGNRSGYGYEYLLEVASYTGWEYSFVDASWEECIQMLRDGRIDLLTNIQKSDAYMAEFDFSDATIATGFITLSVEIDNTKYIRDDFINFDGIKVGVIKGSSWISDFEKLSKDKEFSYDLILYENQIDLLQALENSEIDAILSSNLRKSLNEKIIAQFASTSYFFAVGKGNKDLLDSLNSALNNVETSDPQIESRLYGQYYFGDSVPLSLTSEEMEYLREKGTLYVMTAPNQQPYSYFEDGEHKGIVSDVLAIIETDLGIDVVTIQTSSNAESLKKIQDGEADMIDFFFHDYNWAEQNHVKISLPYLTAQYSAVTLKNYYGKDPVVAIAEGHYYFKKFVEKKFPEGKRRYYDDIPAAVDAVRTGRANITFLKNYLAEELIGQSKYRNLKASLGSIFSHGICVAVYEESNPLLISILNKEINNIGKNQIDRIIVANTLFQDEKVSVLEIIYDYPVQVVIFLLFTSATIFLQFIVSARKRRQYTEYVKCVAYNDMLTGLHTASWLEEHAHEIMQANPDTKFALAAMEIHQFNLINESYGRDVGDLVLKYMASVLKKSRIGRSLFCPGKSG